VAERRTPYRYSFEVGVTGSNQPSDGLLNKVGAWLEGQGYPLELLVANAFLSGRAQVIQSDYFSDPETQTMREIDVVASYSADPIAKTRNAKPWFYRIALTIECKTSRDKPWVLFTSPAAGIARPASVVQRVATRTGRQFLHAVARDRPVQDLPVFRLPERPGFGITQAFTSGQDIPYSAVLSASKAALARSRDYDNPQAGERVPPCVLIFPTVILDGLLCECYLDPGSSEPHLALVERGMLVSRHQAAGMPHTIVTIVTSAQLGALVDEVRTSSRVLFEQMDALPASFWSANSEG